MIALYGELHVGSRHLPAQLSKISKAHLKKSLSWITIHQNVDRLFWQLADQELKTEVVQIKKNVFCVFSSTPWTKLQSWVNWTEGGTHDLTDGDTDYQSLDYLFMMKTFGTTICKFLGVPVPSYEALSTCTINQTESLRSLYDGDLFKTDELQVIRFHVANNQRIFIRSYSMHISDLRPIME